MGGGSIGANGGEKEGGSEDLGASEPMVEGRREKVRTWEGEHQR